MNRPARKRAGVPLPAWFGPSRLLADSEVQIECDHTRFRYHRQALFLSQKGLFLLACLPLREGSVVRLQVKTEAQRWETLALVAQVFPELGTLLRFSPIDGLADRFWEILLGTHDLQ